MKRITILLAAAIAGATMAPAKVTKIFYFADFLVDWQDYQNLEVTVRGGTIQLASPDGASVKGEGGHFWLAPPWRDREDLRYLLKNCADFERGKRCQFEVSGKVGVNVLGQPVLTNVDISPP